VYDCTSMIRRGGKVCTFSLCMLAFAQTAVAQLPDVTQLPNMRVAAVAWTASAVSVGMPAWPGVAVAMVTRPNEPGPAQITRSSKTVPQLAPKTVVRSLRAMLRASGHHVVTAVLHATATPRVPFVVAERPWLESPSRIAQPERGSHWQIRSPEVQCDICAESAAEAEAGEDSIRRNMPDINALTTLQLGGATLKLTSLQPFSLLFKKHF
jgi:hypothetical protein